MVHSVDGDGKWVAAEGDEPMQDDINAFFADPTTAPSPNPPLDSIDGDNASESDLEPPTVDLSTNLQPQISAIGEKIMIILQIFQC